VPDRDIIAKQLLVKFQNGLGEAGDATFVLVHGSWHDGTAWQPTIQHLEGKGHKAFAPTIAGRQQEC